MNLFSCRLRLAVLALFVFGAGSAVAATRYAGTCGAPNSATITAAIAAAAAGDTVLICPGTWSEAVTVNKDNLTIRSSTGNRADVAVSNSGIPFTLTGAAITLKDMTITSTNNRGISRGWAASGSAYTFENLAVTAKQEGIYVDTSAKVTFTNVNVTSSNDDAIYLTGAALGAHVFDTITANAKNYGIYTYNGGATFKDLNITAGDRAIYMTPVYDAALTNVTATSTNKDGIYMDWVATGKTLSFTNVTVTSKDKGIRIDVSGKVTFSNVTVTSSNDDAIRLEWATTGAHVFDTVTATAKKYGIYTSRGGTTFKDINVNATDNDAIYINRPDYAATFTNVTVTSSNDDGINIGWVASGNAVTFSNLNVSARNRGIYVDTSAAVSIQDSVVSSSNGDAIELGYGASGAHVMQNLTLDASGSGILYGAGAPSAAISNVCVNSGQYGVRITQWGSKNVSVSNSKFTSSTRGVYVAADPTYKTTVSGSCIMKSTTPRAESNSTTHTFNGNYWQGVAGGTSYTDGNVRDNSTLASCPVTSCYTPATPSPVADYHFDECSQYTGTAGQVVDARGAYPGTPMGSLQNATPGQLWRYADFSAASRYIDVPSGPALSNWTISVWFKTPFAGSGTHSSRYYVIGSVAGTGDFLYLDRNSGGGSYRWGVYDQSGGTSDGSFRFSTLSNGWHHMALVGQGGVTKLYIDGAYTDQVSRKTSGTFRYLGASVDGAGTTNGQSFGTPLDEFKVFGTALIASQIASLYANELAGKNWDGTTRADPCVAAPDHVRLIHDGSAVACNAESVTVRACASADCSSLYTSGVTGNVTAGDNSMAFTIASGSSETTVAIHLPTTGTADPQTVRLGTSSVSPAPSGTSPDCTNTATSATNTTTACDVSVSQAGFLFDVPTLTAGIASGEVSVQAVKSDDSTQCIPLFQSVTRTVAFWGNYQNPATGTMSVQVNGSAVETTSSPAYSSTYSLAFDATGTAKLTSVRYDDAGQMQLNARYAGSTSNAPPDGGLIVTGSDSFVVKPYGFKLSGLTCDADDKPSSAAGAFCVAGGTFTGTVEAVKYDVDATNRLGATTPNYGQESPTAQTVTFAPAALVNPTTAVGGTLSDFTSSSTGSFTGTPIRATATMVWPNVGTITIKPTMNYLGAGDLTSGGISDSTASAGNVGRFYPHHFSLASGSSVTAACVAGGFTYMDQPNLGIAATVEARNKAGTLTSNYLFAATGGYANLGTVSVVAESADAGTNLSGRISGLGTPAWSAGAYAISATAATFSRAAAPDGAYESLQVGVKAADTDVAAPALDGTNMKATTTGDCTAVLPAADCDAVKVGAATKIRFGRLRLSNAFGTGKANLALPVRTDYWSGNSWVLNSDDSCTGTTLTAAGGKDAVALSNYMSTGTPALAATNLGTSHISGFAAVSGGTWNLTLTTPDLVSGQAPTGSVDVAINLGSGANDQSCLGNHPATTGLGLPWLRSRNGACAATYDRDPSARATFGVYSPETRRTVHVRETF